jgi:hypothetical protein
MTVKQAGANAMNQPKYRAILGPAGSGKTTELKTLCDSDTNYAKMTATTGIAAVNLGAGVATINSVLKFYDLDSLKEAQRYGRLQTAMLAVQREGVQVLAIDEISMMSAEMLDIIVSEWERCGERVKMPGLLLMGDFCQLPPVKGEFAFTAKCWDKFHVDQKTKVYRQDNPKFLEALSYARKGRGVDCAMAMNAAGAQFAHKLDYDFGRVNVAE